MRIINVGVIGVGRWGPNVLRNFSVMDGVNVKEVCDSDNKRLEALAKRYPEIKTSTSAAAVIGDGDIACIDNTAHQSQ